MKALVEQAIEARKKAYAPYSKHPVGAVVVTKEGKVFSGANVENTVFPLGDCAEKVALYKAASEGYRHFSMVVVVTANETLSPPCGSCRQVMLEFSPDLEIIVSNLAKKTKRYKLKELLPHPFKPAYLRKGQT